MNFSLYAFWEQILNEKGAEAAADYAVSLGFSSVEFLHNAIPRETDQPGSVEAAANLGEILKSRGLHTACYSVAASLLDTNADEQTEMLCEHVRRAAAIGSPYLHHTLVFGLTLPQNAPTYEEVLPVVLKRALRVAEYAETQGIRCLYEPQGMYMNGDGLCTFYRAIREHTDNVGICADFGNAMFVDQTLAPILREFPGDICHVHLKDYIRTAEKPAARDGSIYQTRGGAWLEEVLIGQGDVNYPELFALLQAAGYKGEYALETFMKTPFEEITRVGMEHAAAVMNSLKAEK